MGCTSEELLLEFLNGVGGLGSGAEIYISYIFVLQSDSSATITLRTRKFITNRLLARRQFVLDVLHPNRPNVSRDELSEKLAALYKTDKARVVTFGLRTQFGGGRSTGFALIYDDEAAQKKFEPNYRLVRVRIFSSLTHLSQILNIPQSGLMAKVEKASRKLRKERKNRAKKVIVSCIVCHCMPLTSPNSSAVPKRRRVLNLPRRESKQWNFYHIPVNFHCFTATRPNYHQVFQNTVLIYGYRRFT